MQLCRRPPWSCGAGASPPPPPPPPHTHTHACGEGGGGGALTRAHAMYHVFCHSNMHRLTSIRKLSRPAMEWSPPSHTGKVLISCKRCFGGVADSTRCFTCLHVKCMLARCQLSISYNI